MSNYVSCVGNSLSIPNELRNVKVRIYYYLSPFVHAIQEKINGIMVSYHEALNTK